jgi:hypothetical protein
MHIARADRPNQNATASRPHGEYSEDVTTSLVAADRSQARFASGMGWIGYDPNVSPKYRFQVANRHTVLATFFKIGLIPVEACCPKVH